MTDKKQEISQSNFICKEQVYKSPNEYARILKLEGVVVIMNKVIIDNITLLEKQLVSTVSAFPEYLPSVKKYVFDGFGALGNPSSFHNPLVRKIRQWAMYAVIHTFGCLVNNDNAWRIEQIMDRILYRNTGLYAAAESWHRNESKAALPDDIMFGGWINLNANENQYISCVPRTHNVKRGKRGFSSISKAQSKVYKTKSIKVCIPPGGIMIFYEHMIHEVLYKKVKFNMKRLFLGWRLTKGIKPLFLDIEDRIKVQAPIQMRNGQEPHMYTALNLTNWYDKLSRWSKQSFPDNMLVARKVTSKKSKDFGKNYRVIKKVMGSLESLNLRKYTPYNSKEKAMHRPGKHFLLLVPGKTRLYEKISLKCPVRLQDQVPPLPPAIPPMDSKEEKNEWDHNLKKHRTIMNKTVSKTALQQHTASYYLCYNVDKGYNIK
jgi:hypothetical protein